MTNRRILLATLTATALLLAACGSDDGDDASTSGSLPLEEATAKAESALLQLEDVPAGFAVAEDDEDDEEPSPEGCEYLDEFEDAPGVGEAEVSFEIPEGFTEISHSVAYATEELASGALAAWKDERTEECIERVFTESFSEPDQGFELVSAEFSTTTSTEDAQGFAGEIVIGADGDELTMELEVELVRVGAAMSFLTTLTTSDAPVDFDALRTAVDTRLGALA